VLIAACEVFLLYYALVGCKPRPQDVMTNE